MDRIRTTAFTLAALLLLNNCTSMSSEECLASDWQAIGFEHGAQGLAADKLGDHRRACAKHGVTVDFQAYQQGRDQGLWQYCQPSRGFNIGANGRNYNGICAAHQESNFLDAYNSGRQLYRLRAQLNAAESEIYEIERQIDRNNELIRSNQGQLIASEISIQNRVLTVARLKELSEENGFLAAQIDGLIENVALHEQRLLDYEDLLASSAF